jgi:3' exoribonuclease, RNase T-like
MRFYYDTEFHERGPDHPIDFISIGIVTDKQAYYAVHSGFDFDAAMENDWLRLNVMCYLPMTEFLPSLQITHPDVKPRWKIREDIESFILGNLEGESPDEKVELWADYADYDHVILSQIFGRMIDLPKYMPMRTGDIRQEIDRLEIPKDELPKQNSIGEHHALQDAIHDRVLHKFVLDWERKRNAQ